jgi:hypothetical protein
VAILLTLECFYMIVQHSAVGNVKMHIKEDVKVQGCGCRFRGLECEHLCDNHKDAFILEKYNQNLLLEQMIKEDAIAMEEMNKQLKEMDGKTLETKEVGFKYKVESLDEKQEEESLLTKDKKSIDIGKIISKLDEIEKK